MNIRFEYVMFRMWLDRKIEKTVMWIAWHLPHTLVKLAFIRVFANATAGEYSNVEAGKITCFDALKSYDAQTNGASNN